MPTYGKLRNRCSACETTEKNGQNYIYRLHAPVVERPRARSPIRDIASDPAKARIEIVHGRKVIKRLRKELAKVLLDKEMMEKRVLVSPDEGAKVNEALNIMAPTIENVLHEAGDDEACDLWVLHRTLINQHFANSGKFVLIASL